MPAERNRNKAYHTSHPSSATDHRSSQTCGRHDQQHHPQSPVYWPGKTSNQWQNSAASSSRSTAYPAGPWRYPPLPLNLPGPGVPGVENSIQNYRVASRPAPVAPESHLTPGHYHHYPPPGGPGTRRDMWVMDKPSEARTIATSPQWAAPASLSPIDTLDGALRPPRAPVTPLRTYEDSRHEAGNIGNDVGGSANEALHSPWLQSRVRETEPYVLYHPSNDIQSRTVPPPPSMITSQLMGSPLDETLFDPFKFLESVNYLDVDQQPKKQPSSEPGRFFINTGKVKRQITGSLASEFDEFCRSKRPMQPSAKFFIRTEAAVLGRAVFHSRAATLHILTDLGGLIMCPYHTENHKIKGVSDSQRGTRIDPRVQREPGKLHCGCSEDDVILEMMLRKLTVFPAEIEGQMSTMRDDFLNPRERSFVCSLFRNWTGLNVEDMFKFDNDGRVRTYEDLLKMQISGLQNRLAWVEAARHQSEHATGGLGSGGRGPERYQG